MMTARVHRVACCVLFAALALATHNAAAQFPGPPPGFAVPEPPDPPEIKRDVDAEVSRMSERYDLSKGQATTIRGILKDQDKKVRAVIKDDTIEFPDRLAKLKALRDEEIAQVSNVLNVEQRAQYKKDCQKQLATGMAPPPFLR